MKQSAIRKPASGMVLWNRLVPWNWADRATGVEDGLAARLCDLRLQRVGLTNAISVACGKPSNEGYRVGHRQVGTLTLEAVPPGCG